MDKRFVDLIGMFQEELNPSRKVNLVVNEVFDYIFHQFIAEFKNFLDFHPDRFVISNIVVVQNLDERFIKSKYDLYYQLGDSCLNQDLLNLPYRTISGRFNRSVVSTIDFGYDKFQNRNERLQKIFVKTHEHVHPNAVRIRFLLFKLGRQNLDYLYKGLLRGENVRNIENGLLANSEDNETISRQCSYCFEFYLFNVRVKILDNRDDIFDFVISFTSLQQQLFLILSLSFAAAYKVDQAFTFESLLDFFFRLYLDIEAVVFKDLTGDDVPGPEFAAFLRSKLIALSGNELPKTLVADGLLADYFYFF